MGSILCTLYEQFYSPNQKYAKEIHDIHQELISSLDKVERAKVLRIMDLKDSRNEEESVDSFVCGFRLAWQLSNEMLFHKNAEEEEF